MPTEASQTRPGDYRIGDWRFDVDGAALTRGDEVRRLEDRAARTLALLCRCRGEVVTQTEIVAEIWNNRHISPNSVAVVMRDLRRALDDDARAPRHIATVNRRGYRLLVEGATPAPPRDARLWLADVAAVVVGLALTTGALALRPAVPGPVMLVVQSTVNATGTADYGPLTLALHELVRNDVRAMSGVRVLVGERAGRDGSLILSSRLVIWNALPTLSLTVADPETGVVVWSGMAVGSPDRIAGKSLALLDRMQTDLVPAEAT